MNTIKVKRKISSSQLRIAELKDFIGKHVGITLKEKIPRGKPLPGKAAGILSDYKHKGKTGMEKQAWGQEIQEGGNGFRFRNENTMYRVLVQVVDLWNC